MKSRFRILIFIAAATILPASTPARSKNSSASDGAIEFNSQTIDSPHGCLFVNGTLKSGVFFNELQRKDLDEGSQYSKNGHAVTEYPEMLTASIQIFGNRCSPSNPIAASSIFTGDSYTVTFQVNWKSGLDMRPATLSKEVAHCTAASALINTSDDVLTVPALNCEVTVESKGVPLADHLIVSLYGADGKRVTRISAAP
jgi:hypothetical protein